LNLSLTQLYAEAAEKVVDLEEPMFSMFIFIKGPH
jgi:hypothetical protein